MSREGVREERKVKLGGEGGEVAAEGGEGGPEEEWKDEKEESVNIVS